MKELRAGGGFSGESPVPTHIVGKVASQATSKNSLHLRFLCFSGIAFEKRSFLVGTIC